MAIKRQHDNDITKIPTPLEFIIKTDAEALKLKAHFIDISLQLATKYQLVITCEVEAHNYTIMWQNGSKVIIDGDKVIARIDAKHLTKEEQDIFTEEIHLASGVSSGSSLCSPWKWLSTPILKGRNIEEMAEQLYKNNTNIYIEDYLESW